MDKIYQVSELNESARLILEKSFQSVKVEGEISNLSRAPSGHLYFSLKDERAAISCALFRGNHYKLRLAWDKIENGLAVCAQGKISLYAPRGQFQFIIEQMELSGFGRLEMEFQARLQRLRDKGYADLERKKSLPEFIMRIGVITSLSTAALQDVLTTLKRRNPLAEIFIYPSLVQGVEAPKQLIKAIETANLRLEVDVLLLVRGGGSIEDLWAFNDEDLATCIAESTLPIVSGVGHEIDFTLADFAADKRAPTPTAAAEMVSLLLDDYLQALKIEEARILKKWQNYILQENYKLRLLMQRLKLQSPKRNIEMQIQYFDEREQQLKRALSNYLRQKNEKLKQYINSLKIPREYIDKYKIKIQDKRKNIERNIRDLIIYKKEKLKSLETRFYFSLERNKQYIVAKQIYLKKEKQHLDRQIKYLYGEKRKALSAIAQRLQALSPLNVLTRGYSIVENEQGEVISNMKQLEKNQHLKIKMQDGQVVAQVLELKNKS